jgi:hypothetical protein
VVPVGTAVQRVRPEARVFGRAPELLREGGDANFRRMRLSDLHPGE